MASMKVKKDYLEMLRLCNSQGIFTIFFLFFLSRPGIIIQSSNDLRGLMPVLKQTSLRGPYEVVRAGCRLWDLSLHFPIINMPLCQVKPPLFNNLRS